MTHASFANHRLASNERLEFLGDAILGCLVCEHLYHNFPKSFEGDLTKIKSVVVSRITCARISQKLELDKLLIVGKGMQSGGIPASALADVLESIIAAVFLDGGFDAAKELVEAEIIPEISAAAAGDLDANFKSALQQLAQRDYGCSPSYRVLEERGPDHKKIFFVSASIGDNKYPPAWGTNKKEAEQKAAENALATIVNEHPPNSAELVEEKEAGQQ